jgi:hypothetical protein
MDEISFAASFRPPAASSAADVLARRLATPDLSELTEDAAARAAAEARAAQRETMLSLNSQMGDPIGHVSRYQAACSELRGEVDDLEAQLTAARGRLNRAAQNLVHWTEAADEIRSIAAQRSDTGDLLAPAKQLLAGHQQYLAASRAAVAAVQAGTPRQPRPFAGHGDARRSEPVTCPHCIKCGFTPEQSFEIHHTDADGRPIAAAEQADQADQAQREGHARLTGREITRTANNALVSVT